MTRKLDNIKEIHEIIKDVSDFLNEETTLSNYELKYLPQKEREAYQANIKKDTDLNQQKPSGINIFTSDPTKTEREGLEQERKDLKDTASDIRSWSLLGGPSQQKDQQGNPVFDKSGNPVYDNPSAIPTFLGRNVGSMGQTAALVGGTAAAALIAKKAWDNYKRRKLLGSGTYKSTGSPEYYSQNYRNN